MKVLGKSFSVEFCRSSELELSDVFVGILELMSIIPEPKKSDYNTIFCNFDVEDIDEIDFLEVLLDSTGVCYTTKTFVI